MNGEKVATGVIVSASATGHAPAPSIRYSISIPLQNGTTQRLDNVRPIGQTWTDLFGVDVMPLPRGTPVSVSEVAGRFMVYGPQEVPYAVDCDGQPISVTPIVPIIDPDTGLPNVQSESGGGGLTFGGGIGGGGSVGDVGIGGSATK